MSLDKYVFDAPFGDALKASTGQWIKTELTKLQGDEPEDLFLEYILMMIEHKKTMGEIGKELAELIGEEVSVKFAADLGVELQTKMINTTNNVTLESKGKGKNSKAKDVAPAEEQSGKKSVASSGSVASNSKAAMLKNVVRSGRDGTNKREQVEKPGGISSRIGEGPPAGNKSMLDMPLQSRRMGDGRDSSNYSDTRDFKRKRDDYNSGSNEKGSSKQDRPSSSSSSSGVPMMPMMPVLKPGELPDPEAYRGQMEIFAKMQGFGTVDDMVAYQKDMLKMVQAMGIGGGRGDGGAYRGSSSYRGRGASYRGRGRGAFVPHDSAAPTSAGGETFTGTEEVYHFKSGLGDDTSAAVPFSGYRGRGSAGYRGRGGSSFRGGRGAPVAGRGAVAAPAQTKWVRQPDVEGSLSALR